MEKIFIIKVGGNILDEESVQQTFLKNFAAVAGKKILVHGGGKIASSISK